MSCEENRLKYFERVAAPNGALSSALGGEREASAALEQIFNTARSNAAGIKSPGQQHKAAGRTLQLFEEMEQKHGLSRPTHSKQGLRLPRRDAQFGYQAVFDTIEAARTGKALPAVARRVLEQRQLRRTITSVREDDRGYYRCSNCGQFASLTKGHVCPHTATAEDFERALQRRLGVPSGSYNCKGSDGRDVNGLQEVLDAVRSAPDGSPGILMRHCLTGEEIDATLDGAIPALSQGFVPELWLEHRSLRHVVLRDRVVAVLDAGDADAIYPAGALSPHLAGEAGSFIQGTTSGAVQTAAAAYGVVLIPGVPVRSLGANSPLATLPRAPRMPSAARIRDAKGDTGALDTQKANAPASLQTSLRGAPSMMGVSTVQGTQLLKGSTTLHGGVSYDWGHFIGTEYRKSSWHGMPVDACNRTYRVGERSRNPDDWATARRSGIEPAPRGGVAVGRTLVAAVDLVSRSRILAVENGTQLYNADGSELLAVYDSSTEKAGDTQGTPNASAEQMAAILAYYASGAPARRGSHGGHGQSTLNPASSALSSLVADLDAVRLGTGSPLAAADSAYLVLRDRMQGGSTVTLGAQVDTQRCPLCGRWMGDAHNCPARALAGVPTPAETQADKPAPTASAPTPVLLEAQPDTAIVEPPAIASPLIDTPASPAKYIDDGPEHTPVAEPDRSGAVQLQENEEAPNQSLVQASAQGPGMEERIASALDRLADILRDLAPQRSADSPAESGSARVRRRSLPGSGAQNNAAPGPLQASPPLTPPTHPMPPARLPLTVLPLTPQEHILRHVNPPEAPDPYLSRLDPRLGGQRAEPLALHYEELDPAYDVGASSEKALRIVSSSLQIAWDPNRKKALRGTQMRVFGFAGTAGTGKNTTARQIAASLNLPYYETTLHRDTSLQEEIGQTVLHEGSSLPKLGPLGQAAAAGGVICINELVKANPGTLGALQRMMEDGVFEVQGTEAGMAAKEIPVHPSTVFICTWNPGYDGSSDRPDAALLSRIPTIKIDAPDIKDETRRLVSSLGALFGTGDMSDIDGKGAKQKEERLQEILGRDYQIKKQGPSTERVEMAVRFVRDLRNLAQTRQIGASSRHLLEPTPREALYFAAMCEATGDPLLALEQFKIYCDSGEGYDEQFKLVQQIFKRYYGEDGQALNRRTSGSGPSVS